MAASASQASGRIQVIFFAYLTHNLLKWPVTSWRLIFKIVPRLRQDQSIISAQQRVSKTHYRNMDKQPVLDDRRDRENLPNIVESAATQLRCK